MLLDWHILRCGNVYVEFSIVSGALMLFWCYHKEDFFQQDVAEGLEMTRRVHLCFQYGEKKNIQFISKPPGNKYKINIPFYKTSIEYLVLLAVFFKKCLLKAWALWSVYNSVIRSTSLLNQGQLI